MSHLPLDHLVVVELVAGFVDGGVVMVGERW
jgi:hypothetical protein